VASQMICGSKLFTLDGVAARSFSAPVLIEAPLVRLKIPAPVVGVSNIGVLFTS
jgi:hypothetical protein